MARFPLLFCLWYAGRLYSRFLSGLFSNECQRVAFCSCYIRLNLDNSLPKYYFLWQNSQDTFLLLFLHTSACREISRDLKQLHLGAFLCSRIRILLLTLWCSFTDLLHVNMLFKCSFGVELTTQSIVHPTIWTSSFFFFLFIADPTSVNALLCWDYHCWGLKGIVSHRVQMPLPWASMCCLGLH